MFRTLPKSKIHRASVTRRELNYKGSFAIDQDLLDAANLVENEQAHIWNINNRERFITYAIRTMRGSRIISTNGLVVRRTAVGDLFINAAFNQVLKRLAMEAKEIGATLAAPVPELDARAITKLSERGWVPDYLTMRRQADLQPPQVGDALVALGAARIGATRSISNLEVI